MSRLSIIFIFLYIIISGQEKSYPKIDDALENIYNKSVTNFDFKKGISDCKTIIDKSERLNYKKGIGKGNWIIANFLTNSGYYRESLNHLKVAEKNINQTQDYLSKSYIYLEYGKVYGFLNLQKTALKYFDKAISVNKKILDQKQKSINLQIAYACKAESSKFLSRYDSMYFYFKKAYSLDPDPITGANIANYFTNYKKDQIDSADYYLRIATNTLRKKNYDPLNKLNVLLEYGDFYFQKQQYDQALAKQLESEALATRIKRVDERASIYHRLSKTYSKLKNEDKSNEFIRKYIALSDSLKTVNSVALNLSVEKLVDDKEIEKEIEKAELKRKNYLIVVIISFLTIILIFGGYFLYIKKKKEKELIIRDQSKVISQIDNEKRKLEDKVNDAFDQVIKLARDNDPSFLARFKEVYPEFCENILKQYPNMLNSELTFCAYLKLNFTTKEISNYTFVTNKAIELRKNRFRKKMNIPSEENLYVWIHQF